MDCVYNASDQISPYHKIAMVSPIFLEDIFNKFCTVTLSGSHGKTAQYYFQYKQLVHIFLRFSMSSNEYEIYLNSLFNISD